MLLDPPPEVPAAVALQSAEIERLDWSFATPEGAVNALLSTGRMVAAPRQVVEAYAKDDLRKGPDGRLRFSFSPSAVVVAWSEMVLPAPPIARLPTLVVRPQVPLFPTPAPRTPLPRGAGDLLARRSLPNGHNVLWEAPGRRSARSRNFWAARPELAFARLAEAFFAVAEVGAVAAVELVAAGAAEEAVVAAFAVAAVLAGAHRGSRRCRGRPSSRRCRRWSCSSRRRRHRRNRC